MTRLPEEDLRVLSAVEAGCTTTTMRPDDATVVLSAAGGKALSASLDALRRLARRRLLVRRDGALALTPDGVAALRRAADPQRPFLAQHLDLAPAALGEAGEAIVDLSESPLGRLMRARGRGGEPFLARGEFDAGEKLRADYTRGQLMPRLGANLDQPIATGRRTGSGADLSDASLAARIRVERALEAVGPELSGVLVDVCCFLKGLELVERERGWPVRSAKLMLKTGLASLARHYSPREKRPTGRSTIQSWGGEGYRPTLR